MGVSTGDPDVDAVLRGESLPAPAASISGDPDADAVLKMSQPSARAASPSHGPQYAKDVLTLAGKHPFEIEVGAGENFLSGITGGVGSLADAVTLSPPGTHDWAYRPRTEAGQALADISRGEASAAGKAYDKIAGTGPLASTVKEYAPEALGAVGTVLGAAEVPGMIRGAPKPVVSAQEAVDTTYRNSPQSMGAAAAAPRVSNTSPELQSAISKEATKTGGAVNPETLNRHIEADSLPVPMKLTEGQATQDPVAISSEQNQRGQNPALAARFNEQNKQLVQNVQTIRDSVGPDVFSTNAVEHADTLIKAYKDKAAVADADIDAKYQALRDAAGGDFPVDAKQLFGNASAELHKQLLFEHAPTAPMSQLARMADQGSMTFEQFEALRTNLARITRSSTDGNERAAAGIIRNEMEKLPLSGGSAALKPLADSARTAARTQFQALEADPAYKAAVNDTVPADRFVQRFITGPAATRNGVALMRENLEHDPVATQTMGVAAVDHLRRAAGVDDMGNGNFSQAGFNKAQQALDPKIKSLLNPRDAENVEKLGNVARYTQFQPRGSYVNNSNTFVAAAAEHAKNLAEHGTNAVFGGIPIGTITRKVGAKLAEKRAVNRALAPGAGLSRLSDVTKQ